ncbi:MAG: DUF4129 domain-containing protein [Haliscomenobacter sp.]|nr:DUF4129 domain-containing protein [Haliscomenobacter sp.]
MKAASLTIAFFLLSLAGRGQETASPQKAYMDEPVHSRSFDESKWKKTTEGLTYTLRPQKRAKSKNAREGSGIWSGNAGPVMQFFALVFLVLIAAFILRALIQSPKNKKIRESRLSFTANDLETPLPESELDRYLAEAIRSGDYALAIRIYYLQALQQLQYASLIQWKKDKTNREYLRDLRGTPYAADFSRLTLIFEKVRYGEYAPERGEFAFLERDFKSFVQSLGAGKYYPGRSTAKSPVS